MKELTELEKVKAEVGRLRQNQAEINTGATKEVVRLQEKCRQWESKYLKRNDECQKAEAELEKARPLLEAVKKWDGRLGSSSYLEMIKAIDTYRAYKEQHEK